MSSDAVYSILLYDFVISSANNYKKFGSVELGSVQPVFGITRSGITSGDCTSFPFLRSSISIRVYSSFHCADIFKFIRKEEVERLAYIGYGWSLL